MKTKLLTIFLVSITMGIAQTLPNGHFGMFEFTNGSLANGSTNGGPDLSGTFTPGADRFGNSGNSVEMCQALTGHRLGTGTSHTDITLSFWMKSGLPTSTERIVQIYGTGGNGFRLAFDNNHLYLNAQGTSNNGSAGTIATNEFISLGNNQWHHIAIRTQSSGSGYAISLDIFIDNILQTNISNIIDPFGNSLLTHFLENAHLILNPTTTYGGSFDDVYFYKTALTNAQIANIYNYVPITNCTINIPDANFKAYLVGNAAINTNGDTEIQCSEASAFTGTIDCTYLSISDVTGIESFENITGLLTGDNQITSVDVSNNTDLVVLNLQNNQLTNIDVSSATQLQVLRLGDNSLNAIDVSSNINLTSLELNYNQINAIDVSLNTSLEHLYINDNNIVSLDISSNTALNYLNVSNNNLVSLNVANGNNANFYDASNGGGSGNPAMDARQNPNLTCIQIDAGFTPPTSPSSFQWEKDTTATYSVNCTIASIDDTNVIQINIYPNPVNDILNIELQQSLETVEIYSVQGKKIIESENDRIDTSILSPGLYIIKISSEDGKIGWKQFIKN